MKKNFLFVNMFWIFVCGFLGIVFFISRREVEGVWLLSSYTNIIKTLWVPIVLAIICLTSAFVLGKVPKTKDAFIDTVLIETFIVVSLVVITLLMITTNKISFLPKGYHKVFHYFIISAILGYLLFLTLICLLKVCYKIIFTDLKEKNAYKEISLLLTPSLIWSGVLVCLIHAKFLASENIIPSIKGYLVWINKGTLVLLIVSGIFITITHLLGAIFTKKCKRLILCAFLWINISIFVALISRYNYNLGPNFKHLSEVSLFILGAYFIPFLVLIVCYSIRAFVVYCSKDYPLLNMKCMEYNESNKRNEFNSNNE